MFLELLCCITNVFNECLNPVHLEVFQGVVNKFLEQTNVPITSKRLTPCYKLQRNWKAGVAKFQLIFIHLYQTIQFRFSCSNKTIKIQFVFSHFVSFPENWDSQSHEQEEKLYQHITKNRNTISVSGTNKL